MFDGLARPAAGLSDSDSSPLYVTPPPPHDRPPPPPPPPPPLPPAASRPDLGDNDVFMVSEAARRPRTVMSAQLTSRSLTDLRW